LRKIERKYGDRVVVVGVHSPKFPAERETANLREAVLRYRIEHPVVNDREFEVWRRFGGRAWPTLVFIDPEGQLVGRHEGELPFEEFDPLVAGMLTAFASRGTLRPSASTIALQRITTPKGMLSFPGKVLACDDAVFVADTNHHRILETGLDGSLRRAFGCGEPGLVDGPAERAAFLQPQGMDRMGNTLYVADTENHAIRAIELDAGHVSTVAGTGEPARPGGQGGPARRTALSSPWDLAIADGTAYIAMAGTHQVWRLDLAAGLTAPFAGTGREGLKDGPREQAWLAQPSGLVLDGGHLFVADSEVSAVRDLDLRSGIVTTLVGHDLFVFGDQDGVGEEVRLQHPLGITTRDGQLYLADSYNHKIKRLDPRRRTVTSWLGSRAGRAEGPMQRAAFHEPGGVCAGAAGLYIADTNNHRIALADWVSAEVRTLIGNDSTPAEIKSDVAAR
jgi:hypothetical protein